MNGDQLTQLDTGSSCWNETLRRLEEALATGDAEQVASIAVSVTNGPIPPALSDRATLVADRIGMLERTVEMQLAEISHELDRVAPRMRRSTPPAPSHLDCSA